MDPTNLNLGDNPWLTAVFTLFATIGIASITRAFLKWMAALDPKWSPLRLLAPSISNLIYIFGLRLLIDLIPIHPKILIWLDGAVYLLAVVIILWLARRMLIVTIEWGASRSLTSQVLHQGFIPLTKNVVTLFVFLSGGIMVLKHFNYDVMSLVTALGVSSLAVGLASKETLSNMISGFTLIVDRNLTPGDRVNLGGIIGEVDEIGLRSTRIKTGDGNMLIVPNSELVNTKLLNLSSPSNHVTCSTSFRLPYEVPFEKIREICLKKIEQIEKIHKPRGYTIQLASLSEGSQLIQVGFWVQRMEDQGAAVSEFNQELLQEFVRAKIPLMGTVPAPIPLK